MDTSERITVTVKTLTGCSVEVDIDPESRIYELIDVIVRKPCLGICKPSGATLIVNGVNLEQMGLDKCVKDIAFGNAKVIFCRHNLGTAPYSIGKFLILRSNMYDMAIHCYMNSEPEEAQKALAIMRNADMLISYLHKVYMNANGPAINIEDPITLENLESINESKVTWIEEGKIYSMKYESLIAYVADFAKKDEHGDLQIPNPYTQINITEPWRSDFIFMSRIFS